MAHEIIQIITTAGSQQEARKIARHLINRRLAACVQIEGPLESIYHWQDEVETAAEWKCTIKTRRALYNDVEQAILAVHSYEIPEILATSVIAGHTAYVAWLHESTGDEPS